MHKLNSQKEFIKRGDIKLKSSKSQTGKYTGLESKDSSIDAKINKNDLYVIEIRDSNGNVLSSSYTRAVRLSIIIIIIIYIIYYIMNIT